MIGTAFEGLKAGHYRVIYADPAWKFSAGKSKNPSNHYPTMTVKEIAALPVKDLAHPEGCRLHLWITIPLLHRLPEILTAWGFRYSTARVWGKLWPRENGLFLYPDSFARGSGFEVIGNCEMLVIAKRGRPQRIGNKKPHSLFFGTRREHSRKPDEVRDEIVAMFDGPRCELFARTQVAGWDAWGNQVDKFRGEAA